MKKIYFIIALVLLSAGFGIEANANTVEAQKIVRGVVIDSETKEPLVGASVVVAGTTKGVATDVNGKFELSGVKAGDVTLKIEYMGYDAKEMNITLGRERAMSVNVELQPARFS
ncbi:MAG: carboxypeptidase-like regulatory domain-containing protein, partial [Rikenellaceae bacterium]|nr:carboxypeptidase-like regulatory domain-containing protein [Rikenellaceae bacterium]